MRNTALLAACSICLGAATADARAGGVAILFAQGAVTPPQPHARIEEGGAVLTGPGASAIVAYDDGTRLKLKESTRLIVERSGAELLDGGIFAQVKPQPRGSHFRIRARAAVMGVRGTRFFAAFGHGKASDTDLWMCVEEGQVAVEESEHKPVLVNAGFGVFIRKGRDVEPPRRFEWTKKLNWNMDPSAGDTTDHTSIDARYSDLLRQNYD